MNQQVILNIHGFPVRVELIFAKKTASTYHYAFGTISLRYNPSFTLEKLRKKLEKAFPISTIAKFNNEPFYNEDYVYVLGEKCSYRLKKGKELTFDNIYVENQVHKYVTLKKLCLEVITERVHYYEKMMNLPLHEVKVKKLYSILGNNHYTKKLLQFNDKLIHLSLPLIDEVVVHELCHDTYHNHSRDFYSLVNRYCSDYKIKAKKIIFGDKK